VLFCREVFALRLWERNKFQVCAPNKPIADAKTCGARIAIDKDL
jgi:hypothetical protein